MCFQITASWHRTTIRQLTLLCMQLKELPNSFARGTSVRSTLRALCTMTKERLHLGTVGAGTVLILASARM